MSLNNIINQEFTAQIEELENGWIKTPHGIFTPNEEQGLNAYEVYENHIHNLANPSKPEPTLDEKVEEQVEKINLLSEQLVSQKKELEITKQENADLYYELMTSGVI